MESLDSEAIHLDSDAIQTPYYYYGPPIFLEERSKPIQKVKVKE
jgi:hypothetical protein